MFIVVLQIVYLLQCLIVAMGCLLNVSHQGLVLDVQPPILFEVIHSVPLENGFLLGKHEGP